MNPELEQAMKLLEQGETTESVKVVIAVLDQLLRNIASGQAH